MNLKTSSAGGFDNIPTAFVKEAKDIIIPHLTKICNLSMETGIFPKIFKTSLIHPIFKAEARNKICNYRPISVLSVLSKVLEKVINRQLIKFLEKNTLISTSQFGFRRDRSTEDAVNTLIGEVTELVDRKKKVIGVFLDLKKAFDTVSIQILLEKIERFGIRGTPLRLFESYLTDRFQHV